MTNQPVSEIATFRLTEGADPSAFIAAAQALKPFLDRSGGMIRRTLSRDPDGVWTDHVVWRDHAAAERAAQAMASAPEAAAFMPFIDAATVSMRHAAIHLQQE